MTINFNRDAIATRLQLLEGALKPLQMLAVGCVLASAASQIASAEERFFTVLAVEPRGGVNADREPFPQQRLPDGGAT
ncbi:hypothetical protein, partial [Acinetobacter baumannii]|uniref:hypothetical protein n=1 Tax=Acinetobacter baumannii TaxID=470 RepID=UPI00300C7100